MALTGSELLRNTVSMILAGGQGERLAPLTTYRTKPSVPFGGKYRIIDFALSNCLNSGFRKIYVLTQYKSDSLNMHLYEAWNIFNPDLGEYIHSIPPQQKVSNNWYLGTADAIQQNLNLITPEKCKWALLLSGDHIYKMDYLKMLVLHVKKHADLTIATIQFPTNEASRFGVIGVDENYKVKSFIEKPVNPPEMPDKPGCSIVNMGIYIFNSEVLSEVLNSMVAKNLPNKDFGHDVIPYMIKNNYDIYAFKYLDANENTPYWMDIGTIDSYYEASMNLLERDPAFNLYDEEWPLRTKQVQAPPAKTLSYSDERISHVFNTMLTDGTVISGGRVEKSILGPRVRINSFCEVTNSIIFNDCNIGRYSKVKNAIIDKNVVLPPGTIVGYDRAEDEKRFTVTESGITIIPKNYKFG